ncbi:hypothetical protein [Flavobacterium sp. 120]|jgi:hypothetical protein|uniref:hypothetical protein n=1 Tax=Flavobacterium sp. 120 TaxID=2135626 RepID=UPI000EB010BC|nr:hypothetical protein [Flavobacterium sp. 120]RKS15866.1 hypothetical protein C8C87_3234 [Flavobacterium sp. 120]
MRKLITLLIIVLILIPKKAEAQNNGAAAVAAIAGIAAIGAGIFAVEQMKEQAELTATQWILKNHPELTSFSLKTLDFDGKKLKDMSSVSVILFNVQEFQPQEKPELNGKKQVLFGFTSNGWVNENGVNFDKVKWYLIDESEWIKMMTSYVKVASGVNDSKLIKDKLLEGKIVNKGLKINSKIALPFFELTGDMYVVTDYSNDMKFIYNERSLGIFLKETNDLVQIGRNQIIDIHDFFFKK